MTMPGTVRSPAPPRAARRRRLDAVLGVECLLGLATVVVATGAFVPFYDRLTWIPAVVGAVLLGAAVVAVGALLRWWAWLVTLLVPVALVLLLHWVGYGDLTRVGLPTAESVRGLGQGLWRAVPRSLSIGLPVDVRGDLLVLPVLLAGLAGAAVVALLLRTRRITALALPSVLLFVAGLALSASAGGAGPYVTGVLLLLLLALLLVRSNRLTGVSDGGISAADADAVGIDLAARRRRSLRSRLTLGLPAVLGVAALAVAAGGLLPFPGDRDRTDPRSLYAAPFTLRSTLSPLVQVRPQLVEDEPRPLFSVRVVRNTEPRVDRVRVAALDTFDGALWTRSGEFEITGSRLPDLPALGDQVRPVELDVEVRRLPSPFLPVAGEPVRFSGSDFAFDRATGTAVSTGRDVSGTRYTVTGLVAPLASSLRQAEVSDDPELARYTRPAAGEPDWVGDVADSLLPKGESALAQLLFLETYLQERPFSAEAVPGHSYGALLAVLQDGEGKVAYSAEQYASAFAVLARYKGYPARIAVGYRLPAEPGPDGAYQVTTHEAHAWPEVHLEGHGWVPFEPSNWTRDDKADLPRAPDVSLGSASDDGADQAALEETGEPGSERSGLAEVAARSALVAAFVLGGVLVLVLAVALFKVLRRRWRAHRGPPAQRVVAAWREVADRLREAGVRVPASSTGSEVASGLTGSAAAPVAGPVADLAKTVAGALFAYEEPDESVARRAWELERRIGRELGRVLPVGVRVRALVDPRPLLPRRVRRRRHGRASSDEPVVARTRPRVRSGGR